MTMGPDGGPPPVPPPPCDASQRSRALPPSAWKLPPRPVMPHWPFCWVSCDGSKPPYMPPIGCRCVGGAPGCPCPCPCPGGVKPTCPPLLPHAVLIGGRPTVA